MSALPTLPIAEAKKKELPSVLKKIAFCESSGKHFDENGNVVRGKHNPNDVGKYQINTMYWGEDAKKLGHDLLTEEGNEAMALVLYEKQGTRPWTWSRACWDRDVIPGMETASSQQLASR